MKIKTIALSTLAIASAFSTGVMAATPATSQVVVRSEWGQALLGVQGGQFQTTASYQYGSNLGAWQSRSTDRTIGWSDINGDRKSDLILASDWGVGFFNRTGGSFSNFASVAKYSMIGSWQFKGISIRGGANGVPAWQGSSDLRDLKNNENDFLRADIIWGYGDFNGDGRQDILLSNQWGMALVTLSNGSLTTLATAQHGSSLPGPAGSWIIRTQYLYEWNSSKEAYGLVQAPDFMPGYIGDFNGDGRSDILVRSEWGIGVLSFDGTALRTIGAQPWGSTAGEWILRKSDWFRALADFNGDRKSELLVSSSWGLASLSLNGTRFTHVAAMQSGSRAGNGGWVSIPSDRIEGVGDFNGDGRSEYIVRSTWGIGYIGTNGGSFVTIAGAANGQSLGGWNLQPTDAIMGIGDFNNDGREEVVLRSPTWGMGLISFNGMAFAVLGAAQHGTTLPGGWIYRSGDAMWGVGNF